MVPSLSLLTACDPARAQWLPETASSAQAAVAYLRGAGIDADWVVVVDGPGKLPRFRSGEHLALLRTPYPVGISAARNLALATSRADWVLALDADDTLNAAGVAELLGRHHGRTRAPARLPGLPEPAGRVNDPGLSGAVPSTPAVSWVLADHSWHGSEGRAASLSGPVALAAGELADHWQRGWPVPADNLLVRRAAAVAVGGWPAVACAEDVALALLVSEEFGGVADPVPVLRRRTWEGQVSAHAGADALKAIPSAIAAHLNEQRARHTPTRPAVIAPR